MTKPETRGKRKGTWKALLPGAMLVGRVPRKTSYAVCIFTQPQKEQANGKLVVLAKSGITTRARLPVPIASFKTEKNAHFQSLFSQFPHLPGGGRGGGGGADFHNKVMEKRSLCVRLEHPEKTGVGGCPQKIDSPFPDAPL